MPRLLLLAAILFTAIPTLTVDGYATQTYPSTPVPQTWEPPFRGKATIMCGHTDSVGGCRHTGRIDQEAFDFVDAGGVRNFPVYATAPGKVVFAGGKDGQDTTLCANSALWSAANGWGYGVLVIIEHVARSGERFYSFYAHLKLPLRVVVNDPVNANTEIGTAGNSGCSFGDHLHFMARTWSGSYFGGQLGDISALSWIHWSPVSCEPSSGRPNPGLCYGDGTAVGPQTPCGPVPNVTPSSIPPPVYSGSFAVNFVSRIAIGSIPYAPQGASPYAFKVSGYDLTTLPLDWKQNALLLSPSPSFHCGWASSPSYNFILLMRPSDPHGRYELTLHLIDGRQATTSFPFSG
jgi:hypothetical protein